MIRMVRTAILCTISFIAIFEKISAIPRSRRGILAISYEDDVAPHEPPMFRSDLFEGDITNNGLTPRTLKELIENDGVPSGGAQKNAIKNPFFWWPKTGEYVNIPVERTNDFTVEQNSKLDRAIEEFHKRTCIRFVQKQDSDTDYIFINNKDDDGCHSNVGKIGGRQILNLESACLRGREGVGVALHELMHSVGFYHEQSRADRDDYVNVHWKNIIKNDQDQFEKYNLDKITHLGTQYDYDSVMHYPTTAFSKDGRSITIEPKKSGVTIGNRQGFSTTDVYKINKLYKCSKHMAESACPEGWTFYEPTGRCYIVDGRDDYINQGQAAQSCFILGGVLASIHSKDENTFIRDLAAKHKPEYGAWVWLGATKVEGDYERWVWGDGTPWDYTNWYKTEPSNYLNNEKCLQMWPADDGTWNDMSCENVKWTRKYVCSKKF